MSVHNTIIEFMVSAVQAELPNAAIIKAKQEAYEKVSSKSIKLRTKSC